MADKSWIVYGLLGAYGDPAFNSYNGTKWVFNKTAYRAHLTAIANAGANAVRHLPTGGVWNGHPGNKKIYQFCQFKFVSESVGWDLSQWNEAYFDTVNEFTQIENSLGLTTFFCLADNCENNGPYKVYSPWVSNNNSVDDIYDTAARTYFDAFIDKCRSEFSGMDIVWSSGNEMVNAGFPALFNAVIHPLVDAGTLDPDKLTYGTTKDAMFTTVRAYLQAADRNKVIMEVHEGPTATSYKARYAPWAGTGARMLFSDDGCYTGNSACDKTSQKPGPRPSASQWYTAVADVLDTYGDSGDDHVLNFEHLPCGYTDFTKATSTTCQAATIHKMRQAYEEWARAAVQYVVSGYVKTAESAAIAGVSMSGLPKATQTSTLGFYSDKVDSGWSGVVTPSKSGYGFTPASTTYTNVVAHKTAQNYVAAKTNPPVTISGYVKTAGSVAIPRVRLSGLPNAPRTNAAGLYTDTVDYGWGGTVAPVKVGYTFNPTSITHVRVESNKTNQDYVGTGTAPPYTISGYVKDSDALGIRGVTMSGFPNEPITDEDGFYEDDIDSGWSGVATPTKSDFTFVPASTTYTNIVANKTNENYIGTGEEARVGPTAPSKLTVAISGTTTAALSWQDNSIDEINFRIEKSITSPGTDGFDEIATVGANVIIYVATGLTEGVSVWFRVRAYGASGYSEYSNIAKAEYASGTSMPRPAQRLANLPYPFGFKSFDEIRDYLIKLRSKIGASDFSIRLGDIIMPGGTTFGFPVDGSFYEMLTCDEEVLAWGWPGVENTYTGLDAAYSMTTGSYNTLGGYGSGMYLTIEKGNTFYGARSGYLVGDIEGTEETVESTSYDLKYTIVYPDGYHPRTQPICSWDGMIVTMDHPDGAGATLYNIKGSYDGITWTTLLSSTATVGIINPPTKMASFKGSLWYAVPDDDILGCVHQWDGAKDIGHLGTYVSFSVGRFYTWGDKLWTIKNYTATRTLTYTDGSAPGGVPASWTTITNYDGDADYIYNNTYKPDTYYWQETNHLFGFDGHLYFVCSRSLSDAGDGTSAQWQTKILKYDDASAFNVVATITPTETQLHPCGIIELSGTVYLFLSEFGSNGAPAMGDGRLVVYTSTDMLTWTVWKDFGDSYGVVCDTRYFNQRIFVLISADYAVTGSQDTDVYYLGVTSKSLTKETTFASTYGPAGDLIDFNGYLWASHPHEIYRRTASTWIQAIEPDDTFGSYNTFIGYGTGITNLTGRFNTLLGTLADVSNPELENATAIGYRAIVGENNTIVLGGTGAYAVNVAIGKTSASERLDVAGNAKVSGQLIASQGTGTSPLRVISTTVNTYFNADMVDGKHAADFLGLPTLTDPGADRILFWDDSETLLKWLACGNSIAITTTTLDTIQDIRTTAGPTFDHLHLTTDLPVSEGGTGASTFALNGILYGNVASAIGITAIGAQYNILTVGASPFVPAWSGYLLSGTSGGKTDLAVTSGKTLTLAATDSYILTIAAAASVSGTNTGDNSANSLYDIGSDTQAYSATLDAITAGTWIGANSITTLGTIATGGWHGTTIAVDHGGTGKSAWTLYAIPYASGTTTIGEIAIGTAGQVLAVNVGANGYTWLAPLTNPMTDIGDIIIGGAAGAPAKLADVAVGAYLRSGGVTTAPLWSTLILPNAGTAYRLPVFSATNVMTELAAVGATGEYLKGNTGAIPSWANISFSDLADYPADAAGALTNDGAGALSWVVPGGGGGDFLVCQVFS